VSARTVVTFIDNVNSARDSYEYVA